LTTSSQYFFDPLPPVDSDYKENSAEGTTWSSLVLHCGAPRVACAKFTKVNTWSECRVNDFVLAPPPLNFDQRLLAVEARLNAAETSTVPVGSIHYFPSNKVPSGYLRLDGSTVSRSAYPKLWEFAQNSGNLALPLNAKIVGQFGAADGAVKFTLPDFRGLFLRSWDDRGLVDVNRAIGSVQESQNGEHSHAIKQAAHAHTFEPAGHSHSLQFSLVQLKQEKIQRGDKIVNVYDPASNSSKVILNSVVSLASGNVRSASADIQVLPKGGSETRVKNVAVLACIKAN
jgi:microcystin-dependent protein